MAAVAVLRWEAGCYHHQAEYRMVLWLGLAGHDVGVWLRG